MTTPRPTKPKTATDTAEMKAVGAFLAAMHDNHLDGGKMREAMIWALGASPSTAAQPQASAAPSEQDLFERVFPMPEGCMRCGDTYAPTEYSAWSASAFIERFKGWQAARRIQPTPPAVAEPLTSEQLQLLHHIEEFGLFCDYDEFEQIARAIEFAHGIGVKKGGSND